MSELLAVDDLFAGYGGNDVVHGVSLSVAAGEIFTVIGPNGAGKTTLLGAIMGLLPRRGRVRVDGAEMAAGAVEDMTLARVALVPEKRELFSDMTVDDNLLLGRYPRLMRHERLAQSDFDEVFALFPRLVERRRQIAGTLSGGERQMLALARAMIGRPRLLLLDEPSLGLAPRIVEDVLAAVSTLAARGMAVLLVEQNARAALQVADRGCVLELGSVTLSGPAAELCSEPRVIESYLGIRR
jgi:branched-chain amino acid transport system ATP-binding protein